MSIRLGIDTGGTFTDVVAEHAATGKVVRLKVPSTPSDPSEAIATGVQQALAALDASTVDRLVHGTTVATNALLERRGARTALVTTGGFRDLLAIGRQNRPSLYDLRARRTPPLIDRRLRWEVAERVGYDGRVRLPLDLGQLEQVIDQIAEAEAEAVVVGFLFSHINPVHELAAGERIAERLPHVAVTLSHRLAALPGEYERLSTAAVNAFVQPVMRQYLSRLTDRLRSAGVAADVLVMKSSGGISPAELVAARPVETVLSGPAGGVMACARLATESGHPNLIAADMGGTSFDVAVVTEGTASQDHQTQIAGHPLRTPMLDLSTIGAGGGSIAWVDVGGALRVGPQSAGAVPGPACYRRGGTQPTVSDANLVLGRLDAAADLAGGLKLDAEAAREAIDQHVARPLGLTIDAAATGILQVVNTAMTTAIRKITVERGIDPRPYALCAYGGAGPLHAAELAAELGIRRVVVPAAPGVFSAEGLLSCNLREDCVHTHIQPLDEANLRELAEKLQALAATARTALGAATAPAGLETSRSLGLRYLGQSNELQIPFGERDTLADLASRFAEAHQRLYGFCRTDHSVEIASLWATVAQPAKYLTGAKRLESTGAAKPLGERLVSFAGRHVASGIYRRTDLPSDSRIAGPAIVEQQDTTIVVPPDWQGETDRAGNLILSAANSA